MLGILIGTACLFGLIKTLRWGRMRRFGGGGCGGGWSGRGGGWGGGYRDRWSDGDGFRGGWGGEGFFLRAIFERLDATPAQEKVIAAALDELRETARSLRGELRGSRADVAKAMRGESFDEVLFGEMFARHDTALEAMRKAAMGALAKVHVVLDERQRARLADLIESGPGAFRGFRGGPWSGHAYA